ncbi:MAG: hypothetical protein CBC48_16405 [bacterium TMED88]|nr:hypothetical protein [Deltaproteobacteria bacterium]OUV25437.1 MAG: hypothetical protein CBC48_16405 [bacterium TMED88]
MILVCPTNQRIQSVAKKNFSLRLHHSSAGGAIGVPSADRTERYAPRGRFCSSQKLGYRCSMLPPKRHRKAIPSRRSLWARLSMGLVGGLAISALFLLLSHDAWIEHPAWDPSELAFVDVCDLCELGDSIPGGASFDEPARVLSNGLVWDVPPHRYAFSPTQRISAEPSTPRAPPAHSV